MNQKKSGEDGAEVLEVFSAFLLKSLGGKITEDESKLVVRRLSGEVVQMVLGQ